MLASQNPSPLAALETLTEWVITCGGCLHDVHGGFTWSLRPWLWGEAQTKDLFVVVASYRNIYDLLIRHLPGWVRDHLRFDDDDSMPASRYEHLWAALDVQPAVAEKLVEFRARFHDGYLCVSTACRGQDDLEQELFWVIVGVGRFVSFAESRWLHRPIHKAVVVSHLFRLGIVLDRVRRDPKCSDYYSSGAAKLTSPLMHACVVAALSAAPAENSMAFLLEDGRVMLHIASIKASIYEEVVYLGSWPSSCWGELGGLCSRHDQEIRSDVLSAAAACACFFSWRVLAEAEELPWSLVRGDREANLAALAKRESVDEPTAAKIKSLVERGYPTEELLEGLSLIAGAPWSSRGVEQGHAGASQAKKFHPEFGERSMIERLMLRSVMPLALPSEESRQRERLVKRVAQLGRQVPLEGRRAALVLQGVAGHGGSARRRQQSGASSRPASGVGETWG